VTSGSLGGLDFGSVSCSVDSRLDDMPNPTRHCCAKCGYTVCGTCLARGLSFDGGGAFADMLTPTLARSLLADSGWFRYKARAYFYKADHNASGMVDKPKARRVCCRLAFELGVKQMSDAEIVSEIRRLGRQSATDKEAAKPSDGGFCRNPEGGEPGSDKLLLDEAAFEEFLRGTLSRGLLRLESVRRLVAPAHPVAVAGINRHAPAGHKAAQAVLMAPALS